MRQVLLVEDDWLNQGVVEDIFRYNNLSHNTLAVDGQHQRVDDQVLHWVIDLHHALSAVVVVERRRRRDHRFRHTAAELYGACGYHLPT